MSVKKYINDTSLILGIKKEEEAALKQVYAAYYQMVRRLVCQNSGNDEDAQDIYQEAIVVIYENIKANKLDDLNSSLKTYVYAVSRNIWYKKLREKKRLRLNFIETVEIDKKLNLNLNLDIDEEPNLNYEKAMKAAMIQLTGKCRNLLVSFYYEKLKMDEIAAKMGIKNANTAKSMKNKCMNKIKSIAKKELFLMNYEL